MPDAFISPTVPESRRIAGVGGQQLAVDFWPGEARPLVFAHGFGQSRLSWTQSAERLARRGYQCLAVDGRGHGDSDWNPLDQAYAVEQFIGDAELLARSQTEAPIWVGASMGGLIGIALAATHPELLKALVLVDVTPRWEVEGVNRILDFMRAHPEGFASVAEAQQAVANYLPHRAQRQDPNRLARMLVPMANGRLRWHWDPRLLGDIGQSGGAEMARLNDAARSLRLPVLLISGEKSDVVSEQTIHEFLRIVPHAEHRQIARATHMVVGDDNDAFTTEITEFLNRFC